MKLMKATLMRLWRLTRATSIVVGLAVMVALVGGVVSLALAKPPAGGEPPPSGGETAASILKGVTNTATTVTTLINSGTGAALNLVVQSGEPPLTVNPGAGTATGLSADTVDGKDSTDFVSATDGKAPDSELLDGIDSKGFATATGENGTAKNADMLDGLDHTDFARSGTGVAYASEGGATTGRIITEMKVPEGIYVITGSANSKIGSLDPDDGDIQRPATHCAIVRDDNKVITDALEGIEENGAESLSMTYAFIVDPGTTARVSLQCTAGFEHTQGVVHNGKLTAIRVSSVTPGI